MDQPNLLSSIRIATPCPANWEKMIGDDRVRHCEQCDLNVYNLAELTSKEIGNLFQGESRVCGRLYRRDDGTVITKDCPVGLKALRKRVARRTAAALTAILSLAGVVLPQQRTAESTIQAARLNVARQPSDVANSIFEGVILDSAGTALSGAVVTLQSDQTGKFVQTTTDLTGRFNFADISSGTFTLKVVMVGFKDFEVKAFELVSHEKTDVTITPEPGLRFGHVNSGILGISPIRPKPSSNDMEMLMRLPINND